MSETDKERMLLNLLATIHGDGGHYTAEHGLEESVATAVDVVSDLHTRVGVLRRLVRDARERESGERDEQ